MKRIRSVPTRLSYREELSGKEKQEGPWEGRKEEEEEGKEGRTS